MRNGVWLRRGFFIALLGLLVSVVSCACAAVELRVTDPAQAAGESVVTYRSEDEYTLSIPGIWDASRLSVQLSGAQAVRIGESTVQDGQTVDFAALIGKRHVLKDEDGQRIGAITVYQGSQLPVAFLTVDPDGFKQIRLSKENQIEEGQVSVLHADGEVAYQGELTSFRCRGNSTFLYDKRPYQLKLESKADLCGMGRSKTWLLLANWIDLSLLRNQIALDLSQAIGMPYAVECEPIDLYINGSYNGLYLLTEKIQIGQDRVDIYDLEEANEAVNGLDGDQYEHFDATVDGVNMRGYELPEDPRDITGGYILEVEKKNRYDTEVDNGFATEKKLYVTIKEPTQASRAQVSYMARRVNDLHNALLAKDGVSPDTGIAYSAYIDLESFALKFLVEDFTKNYDYLASSQFFFKDVDAVDARIFAGPCWDYDLSMGNLANSASPWGSFVTRSPGVANLYWLLSCQDDFMAVLRTLYAERMEPALKVLCGLAEPGEGSHIKPFGAYVEAIEASAAMNFVRWPAKRVKGYLTASGTTFESSCARLETWIGKRLEDMTNTYGGE